jgi:hypothetical protein
MDFHKAEVDELLVRSRGAHAAFGGSDADASPIDADVPRPFAGDELLKLVEATGEMMGVSEHIETLLIRLRSLLADRHMTAIVGDKSAPSLEEWLQSYIGSKDDTPLVRVLDLSLVPSEIVHVVAAVVARMTFEALQRYRREHGSTLPTVLVMEEAHTFVRRYRDDVDDHDVSAVCCQVFERIAREGRKFGLGLVLSSQRPSELSPTVLSQCNTFLLHRLSNDRDQELASKLVPDNLRGLLRELPSLPSQQAILMGWATELPVLVRMLDLPQSQQPKSEDPDYWEVWTGRRDNGSEVARPADWKSVTSAWLDDSQEDSQSGGGSNSKPKA